MFTKWRLSSGVKCKNCEGGFSFLLVHLGSNTLLKASQTNRKCAQEFLSGKKWVLKS